MVDDPEIVPHLTRGHLYGIIYIWEGGRRVASPVTRPTSWGSPTRSIAMPNTILNPLTNRHPVVARVMAGTDLSGTVAIKSFADDHVLVVADSGRHAANHLAAWRDRGSVISDCYVCDHPDPPIVVLDDCDHHDRDRVLRSEFH